MTYPMEGSPVHTTPRSRTARSGAVIALASVLVLGACTTDGSSPEPDPAAPEPAASGGTAVVALIQEPGIFSPLFTTQSGAELAYAFTLEPMFLSKPDGTYDPYLASEIPTLENGGVSEDGTVIEYRIREGVTWSDGEPFTADDLAFTLEAIKNPEGEIVNSAEYAQVESWEVVDDLSIAVTMESPVPNYLELFNQVMPEHRFDDSAISAELPDARIPLGTGPFVFDEWNSGSEAVLSANENYWGESGPLLDGVVITMVPDAQNAINGFINGEYDTVAYVFAGDMAQLLQAEADGAPISVVQSDQLGFVEWLWINHSDQGDPSTPHPVLGDLAVRQAINQAIDRQAIIDDVLNGVGSLTGSFVYAGTGSVVSEPPAFDPEAAAAILDDAGWVPGSDGIREKDGVRATLRYTTIAGDQTRALYQQLVQQNLGDIGIEVIIENLPSNSIFDPRAEGGILGLGDFDLMMSRDGYYPDPQAWIDIWTTSFIPADDNPDGFSYAFRSDPTFDALADEARVEVDLDTRAGLISDINDLFVDNVIAIPLYASGVGYVFSDALGDVNIDSWDGPWSTASTLTWSLSGE